MKNETLIIVIIVITLIGLLSIFQNKVKKENILITYLNDTPGCKNYNDKFTIRLKSQKDEYSKEYILERNNASTII